MRIIYTIFAIASSIALAACSTTPRSNNVAGQKVTYSRQPATTPEQNSKCWEQYKAAANDLAKLGAARASCNDEIGDAIDLRFDKASGQASVRVRLIDFSTYNTPDGFAIIYTPFVTIAELSKYLDPIRNKKPALEIPFGGDNTLVKRFDKISLRTRDGKLFDVASTEKFLEMRARECASEETYGELCEESANISSDLEWIYNNAVSIGYDVSWTGAKFGDERRVISKWNGNSFVKVKSVTELIPEASLMAALKNDWLIRNSDAYAAATQAKTVTQFLGGLSKNEYSKIPDTFTSYSIRLNANKRKIAVACAQAFDNPKSTPDQRGLRCLKKNNVTLYKYRISPESFSEDYEILSVSPTTIRVAIPFSWESATEHLRFDAAVSNSAYVHYIATDKLREQEKRDYSANRCQISFNEYNSMFIEASKPQLLSPANECL